MKPFSFPPEISQYISNNPQLLTFQELARIKRNEPIERDFIYSPVIYNIQDTDDDIDPEFSHYHSLHFNDEKPPLSLIAYSGRVTAGQTLRQVLTQDLEKDFSYPQDKALSVGDVTFFDTVKMNQGENLARLLVWTNLGKFETSHISPEGKSPYWVDEGEDISNPVKRYFK